MPRQWQAGIETRAEAGKRRLPFGAEIIGDRIDFRVWAPGKDSVKLVIEEPEREEIEMVGQQGFFCATIGHPGATVLYRFRLNESDELFPDPASRFQTQGPRGLSQVIDPSQFVWTDQEWAGPQLHGQIIYELHVGTFTSEGTWRSAAEQLAELADAGISLIEMMPVADFSGRFGWGYDGVSLFAPTRLYGRPDDLRSFIDAAHQLGIAVILDVVYNHVGPAEDLFKAFSEHYFTDRYQCEWGEAINFDGPNATPVREFFLSNARYWIEEFHFDGFRLDATQQIFDASRPGIIAEIVEASRRAAGTRTLLILGENEPQKVELLRSPAQGGAGLDALWNDDFHHTMLVALTGRAGAYYSDYCGSAQEIVSATKCGYLYQGQRSRWQGKPRGTPSLAVGHERLACYLENHDQVANSAWGHRLGQLTSPGRHRAATTLLLLGPWTPVIFQGQEFDASNPFLFFAEQTGTPDELVAEGRKQFLSQFPSLATRAMRDALAVPADPETFARSKLDFRQRTERAPFYAMFKDLVKLRRTDVVFSQQGQAGIDGAVLGDRAFVLRFFGSNCDRLLLVNLGADLFYSPISEPLLAPPAGHAWRVIFSTEDPHYGGSGIPDVELDQGWRLPAEAAIVMASQPHPLLPREGTTDGPEGAARRPSISSPL